MLEGFTVQRSEGRMVVYCNRCVDHLPFVAEYYEDTAPLNELIRDASAHFCKAPPDPKRYDVYETHDGDGFIVWDRVKRRAHSQDVYKRERDVEAVVDAMNAKVVREAA